MTFLSPSFMFIFLPVAMTVYALTPKYRRANILPLIGCLLYVAVNIRNAVALAVMPVIVGAVVASVELYRRKKIRLGLDICRVAAMSAIFSVLILRILLNNGSLSGIGIILYLMNAVSICSDVPDGKGRIPDSPLDTVTYMTFFPLIFVGPFIKYGDFVGKIDRLDFSIECFTCGSVRIISGVIKCIAVSAVLGEAYDRLMAVLGDSLGVMTVVILVIIYGLRVYYFFSGYSEIACGLAAMVGVHVGRDCRGGFVSVTPCEGIRNFLSSLLDFCRSYITIPVSEIISGISGSTVAAVFAAFFYALLFAINMETVYTVMLPLTAAMMFIVLRTGKKRGKVPFALRVLGGATTFFIISVVLWYIELGGPDNMTRILDTVSENGILYVPTHAIAALGDPKHILLPLVCGVGCKLVSMLFRRDNEYLHSRQLAPTGEAGAMPVDGMTRTVAKYAAAIFLLVTFCFAIIILLPQYPELASIRYVFPFI